MLRIKVTVQKRFSTTEDVTVILLKLSATFLKFSKPVSDE